MENNLAEGIAFQIRATRDKRKMTQADLARESEMAQNNISRMESPEYGKHSISSLRRIAEALEVALMVRFVPFSQYIDWLSGTPYLDDGIRPEALAVPSFADEEKAGTFEANVRYHPVYYNTAIPQHVSSVTNTERTVPQQGTTLPMRNIQEVTTQQYLVTAVTPELSFVERAG